jgi:hypothetical protein
VPVAILQPITVLSAVRRRFSCDLKLTRKFPEGFRSGASSSVDTTTYKPGVNASGSAVSVSVAVVTAGEIYLRGAKSRRATADPRRILIRFALSPPGLRSLLHPLIISQLPRHRSVFLSEIHVHRYTMYGEERSLWISGLSSPPLVFRLARVMDELHLIITINHWYMSSLVPLVRIVYRKTLLLNCMKPDCVIRGCCCGTFQIVDLLSILGSKITFHDPLLTLVSVSSMTKRASRASRLLDHCSVNCTLKQPLSRPRSLLPSSFVPINFARNTYHGCHGC